MHNSWDISYGKELQWRFAYTTILTPKIYRSKFINKALYVIIHKYIVYKLVQFIL